MYLKRLEVYGFKTFAQRTIFEFPPGVTAVVGPNGSGKSNVADAVRWVLGEQSFANLRSKRTDDLIFGGGKGRAPMGFAEVFLTIDNSDRLLALPYDEVTIGRRAYRNGENEYTINRARVRLREVADAVAPLGSSYTLINQGLVDSALALQPEDRRRLFEDAAEIGPYQAKKQEAERRLRETESNLVRLSDLVSELEPQLRTLKRQSRDAEAVGAVEAELHELLRHFYAHQWTQATTRLDAATADESRLAAELVTRRVEREQAAQTLQAEREQARQQRATLEQQRAALADLQRGHEVVAREQAVTAERIAGLERRQRELGERRQALQSATQSAQDQTQHLQERADHARKMLEAEQTRLTAAEAALQRELTERRAVETALAAHRAALLRAQAALQTEETRQHEIAQRLALVHAQQAELESAITHNDSQTDARRADLVTAQHATETAEQAIVAAIHELESRRVALEQLRQRRDELDEQITAAKRTHGELQARYDALNRLVRSYEGTFAGVRAAMQWAEREGRSGFALVSSLLAAPPELETAIEVALGARLQNIVVEHWSDAEAAIVQLKRVGAGRATFLPLDTLKIGRRLTVPQQAGLRGIAAELVTVAPQYTPVATYLLGRTLIAEDLAVARRALPQLEGGWTIVTLSGEQIATGGAVTGGAATKESGTLRRERELRELPQQLAVRRAAVDQLVDQRMSLAQQIDALQSAIRGAETAVREARNARDATQRTVEARRRDVHRAEDEAAGLMRRQSALAQEQTALQQRQVETQTALEAAQQAHLAAHSTATAAEAVLAEQIVAMGNDEDTLRELRANVARLEGDLRSEQAQLGAHQQAMRRATDELAQVERQAQQTSTELQPLMDSIAQLHLRQSALADQVGVATEQLAAAQRVIHEQEQHLETLEAQERELTSATLALEAAHGEAAVELQRRLSERDAVWERAAEDGIDVEQLAAESLSANDATQEESTHAPTQLTQRIDQLRARLRRMGPVNALAPDEYRAAHERYTFMTEQLADVRSAATALRDAIGQLDHVMQEHFESTFEAVGKEFGRTFTQLFGGGTARLVLLRSDGEGNAHGAHGIDIVVQPPGKRQLNLQLLSGGERALTAAALLFAILHVNPSPFCILDEVDAALDEANVVRFREALLQLAERTQFILITHNRGTVEAADTLYGITMAPDGGSRVLSLRLEEVAEDGSVALIS